jgi:multidrug transporter EmrE-like cation transporter
MMARWYGLLAVALVFNAVANILMKAGMRNAPEGLGAVGMIKHYLTSWPVIVGLLLFALNVIAYTQALTKLPLSVAYPIMTSLGFLIVVSASAYFFKETITWVQGVGFALIVVGVICVARPLA